MQITFASTSFDMRPLAQGLAQRQPGWRIRVWPEAGFEQAEVVVGWNCPAGLYAGMPRLRLVQGITAGVDNLIEGQVLGQLPVCRVIDESQAQNMAEFISWSVLYFYRGFDRVIQQQAERQWARPLLQAASNWRVGVMGLGAMGAKVATSLARQGFDVRGWSRSPKQMDGVRCFAGDVLPDAFLGGLDTLVCLLPLTQQTQGILNAALLYRLPVGATLVHAGRGGHLVVADLVRALHDQHLRGAIVDVFPQEPLSAEDPLWATPHLLITPHMATMASSEVILAQIQANIERLARKEPLQHRVDTRAGY